MADPRDAEIARYDLDLMESRMVKDQWGGEWVRHSDHAAEIAQLRAERDAALAQVAGAYEAMIRWLIEAGVAGDAPEDPLATCLRALTPASALAALSRRDAQMRAEGMREAAEKEAGNG